MESDASAIASKIVDSRWVLHLDMDAFFASVEQLTRPTLRGRPVLVGGLGGRGVVAGASYESRVFGARSAMPMHQARRLVGVTAVVLPPRGVVYGVASRRVFDTVRAVVPVVAGSGKQIAKIASGMAKPDGVRVVGRVNEKPLLGGLPVRRLWGIGPVAEEKLHRLGIETIGQLAALSEAEVASILGATIGLALHRLARGVDDRPVAERAEAKQISAESTFAVDLTSLEQLREAIDPIAEHAHQRLLRDGRGARTVTVKLKKSDMSTLTRSATLPYATTEAAALTAMARRLLLDPQEIGPIRLLGVGFSGLSDVRQESLFPDLELSEPESQHSVETVTAAMFGPDPEPSPWRVGDDVTHRDLGHGWVQGAGHGVVTVRFETRSSGPGPARTFSSGQSDTGEIVSANPVDSLDWPDYVAAMAENASAQTVDDVAQR